MNCQRIVLPALVLFTGIFALASQSHAQERTNPDGSVRCLSLTRITSTEVLSNDRIVFETSGNKYFLNTLSHACPGLSTNKAFMYRTSLNQLCDLDTITVLDDIGFGFMGGATCGLGTFSPITEQELKNMKAKGKQRLEEEAESDTDLDE